MGKRTVNLEEKPEAQEPQVLTTKNITSRLFSKTFETETITIEGTSLKFIVKALDNLVINHIRTQFIGDDNKVDFNLMIDLFTKFGLCGIENPDDETYEDGEVIRYESEEVSILGEKVECLSDRVLRNMKSKVLKTILTGIISEISEITPSDERRLEFFRQSPR